MKNRRNFFKKLGLILASLPFSYSGMTAIFDRDKNDYLPDLRQRPAFKSNFSSIKDRVWIGEKYWAIPMEDWRVQHGRVEFAGAQRFSRVNLLTTVIEQGAGEASVKATLGVIDENIKSGSAGFSIGIKDEADTDVKAACYYGKGINAGVSTTGEMFIGEQKIALPPNFDFSRFQLSVELRRHDKNTKLLLTCKAKDGGLTKVSYQIDQDVDGLVALVNNFNEKGGAHFWFNDLRVSGSKVRSRPANTFGPVLWAMYTLSNGTLNITAQMPPLGKNNNKTVDLLLQKAHGWEKVLSAIIDETSYTAQFQLEEWNAEQEVPYRLLYEDGGTAYAYKGSIRKEPLDKPLKFGGLTCQHGNGYPYTPLVKNLKKHDPDILYFSGDQLYEQNGGYPIKRQPEPNAILSYLGKWYMFGWAFGDLMRDRPTVCTPDDHDVFQGNLWGEGGAKISFNDWKKIKSDHGGYVQTPKMVNVVHRTQCSHMPAPFHAEPLKSGITTWYTNLVYGKVSFAIISDRMFKSGPEMVRNKKSDYRRDHIHAPLGKNEIEDHDLEMLGARQMEFLEHWVSDWKGAEMKVMLSQTIFANVSTHHGPRQEFLLGDMDSGGWPKQKRDEALKIVRKAYAFHINGDQHLPFMVQYGLDEARDAGWTFCTPAISVGYPRSSQPDTLRWPYTDRPTHNLPNTGVYTDVFGNANYVYAVGNPEEKARGKNRYETAQNKASGFGLVTFDTGERTIKMEAFRFLADKDDPSEHDVFPGWPLTISQGDNDGRKAVGYLPELNINQPDQVVKIINEQDNEVVNILRIRGSVYQPKVYKEGSYTVVVGEGKNIMVKNGVKSTDTTKKLSINII